MGRLRAPNHAPARWLLHLLHRTVSAARARGPLTVGGQTRAHLPAPSRARRAVTLWRCGQSAQARSTRTTGALWSPPEDVLVHRHGLAAQLDLFVGAHSLLECRGRIPAPELARVVAPNGTIEAPWAGLPMSPTAACHRGGTDNTVSERSSCAPRGAIVRIDEDSSSNESQDRRRGTCTQAAALRECSPVAQVHGTGSRTG